MAFYFFFLRILLWTSSILYALTVHATQNGCDQRSGHPALTTMLPLSRACERTMVSGGKWRTRRRVRKGEQTWLLHMNGFICARVWAVLRLLRQWKPVLMAMAVRESELERKQTRAKSGETGSLARRVIASEHNKKSARMERFVFAAHS